jgi:hypothetical protein
MTLRLTESQESVATELVSEPAGAGYDTCEEKNDFIVTDDIEIYPMSTIKCIVLLNKLNVKI